MDNAISLSGRTGTKLKSEILRDYYKFWWGITSGGAGIEYRNPTAIVEMNAATGEVYIEDSREIILGSAGHALQLKMEDENTHNLKIVCIEGDDDCYGRLKEVIRRRWPTIPVKEAEGPVEENSSSIYLVHASTDGAIDKLSRIRLGNSIFFFDPLRNYDWNIIDKVARSRIKSFFRTGTEFIVFLFTSDWFLGREELQPLPITDREEEWSDEEFETVQKADALFGDQLWRSKILIDLPRDDRQRIMRDFYRNNLLRWFRYILPLPFAPKPNQLYHLFFCSNYDLGIKVTRDFYVKRTGNPEYKPVNPQAYKQFQRNHPALLRGVRGNVRPLEWKILWQIVRYCEGGISDALCNNIRKISDDIGKVEDALAWLKEKGYLEEIRGIEPMWEENYPRYKIDWGITTSVLKIESPSPLMPIAPTEEMMSQ